MIIKIYVIHLQSWELIVVFFSQLCVKICIHTTHDQAYRIRENNRESFIHHYTIELETDSNQVWIPTTLQEAYEVP